MRLAVRAVAIGVAIAALFGFVGFAWFVAISWNVLQASLGLLPLVLLLVIAMAAFGAWASVAVNMLVRPTRRPMSRPHSVGIAAVSLLAAASGLVAVPATRDRLEHNKCRKEAAPDAASQARCRDRLEGRREWWTLGLSHRNS
jgi:hypothetical protein